MDLVIKFSIYFNKLDKFKKLKNDILTVEATINPSFKKKRRKIGKRDYLLRRKIYICLYDYSGSLPYSSNW